MWQLYMETADVSGNVLTWKSGAITRCTMGMDQPVCPPFTYCLDNACTMCEQDQDTKTHVEL